MSRTTDLVLARLRMLGQRWETPTGPSAWEADSAQSHDTSARTVEPPAPVELVETHPREGPYEPRDPRLLVPRTVLRLGVLVVVMSLAFAGWSLVGSWPRTPDGGQPTAGHLPVPSTGSDSDPAAVGLAPLEPLAAPSPSPSLTVHVVGDVRHPGVVSVAAGSRVADVVAAAGGFRKGAKLGTTNLARVVADGERVDVGEGAQPVAPSGGATGAGAQPAGAVLDLNSATAAQLDALPGIGPVTAAKILAWRTQNGRFSVVEELAEVPGIGPKTLEELRPLVRV